MLNILIIPDPDNKDIHYSSLEFFKELSRQRINYSVLDLNDNFKNMEFPLVENIIFDINEINTDSYSHLLAIHIDKSKKLNKIVKRIKIPEKIGFNLGFRYSPYTTELKKGKITHILEIYNNIMDLLGLEHFFDHISRQGSEEEKKMALIIDGNALKWPKQNWIFFFRNPSIFRYEITAVHDNKTDYGELEDIFSGFKVEVREFSDEQGIEKMIDENSLIICFTSKWAFIASGFGKHVVCLTDKKSIIKPISKNCIIINNRSINVISFDSLLTVIREINNEV